MVLWNFNSIIRPKMRLNNLFWWIFFSAWNQFSAEKVNKSNTASWARRMNSVSKKRHACTYKETHAHTWRPWAAVGGQHGAKDMHILKVIDWKELTCRHSEEFSMQAWHAHPHICWDRKGAAWEKVYTLYGGKRREMQPLTSCRHAGFMHNKAV